MFSRPIRWIMALHGDVVVPFAFAGVLRYLQLHMFMPIRHPPPPLWLVKLYWLCPWLEIIYAKSRVVGYWIYSEEKLLGTPGAFSLLDIHVGSIMVTTFDPHMIWALHWEYSMITPSKGQLFFLIKFYMGTLWVQMYNTLVVLLFVEVSHLPILCPFVLFRILLLFYTQCTVS